MGAHPPRRAPGPVWVDCGLRETRPRRVGDRLLGVLAWRVAVGWRARWGGGVWAMAHPVAVVEQRDGARRRRLVPDLTLAALAVLFVPTWLVAWRWRGRRDE
jgi:hypothetical protein